VYKADTGSLECFLREYCVVNIESSKEDLIDAVRFTALRSG
jgi:hypothetical protein